ncbi:hypothetical protein ACOSP7_012081 [Xanthoceras sorbifolium]
MGLSSKQVSRDGVGWNQALLQGQTLELPKPPSMKRQQPTNQQQQQAEPLKCPRCDSINTKFCYYNNYNKSQPRHFCKTCKRHWTKGGTLRNVPVGGGRKNKRLKTSKTSAAAAAATTTTTTASTGNMINNNRVNNNNPHVGIQCQQPIRPQNLAFAFGDQKNLSDILYQAMIHHHPPAPSSSNLDMKDMMGTKNNGIFIGSSTTLSRPQNQSLLFPYSISSTSFDTGPSSISPSIQSSNVYNYAGETIDDPTTTSTVISTQPWQVSTTIGSSTGMDTTTSYWNWDDINTFASTDLNIHNWVDDSDNVKP